MVLLGTDASKSLLGACVFLCLVSLVLWCAAVASWAPFSFNDYAVRGNATVRNVTTVQCTGGLGNVYEVVLSGSSVSTVALAQVYTLVKSVNASAAERASYAIGSTVVNVYSPSNPVAYASFGDAFTCAVATSLTFPASAAVYFDSSGAMAARQTWLGVWVTFVIVFSITLPLIIMCGIGLARQRNMQSARGAAELQKLTK